MTFSTLKPDPGPSPKDDVTQIQTNFFEYDRVFTINHTSLNDNNQGDHEGVIIENRTNDPGVTQDLAVLFNKNAVSKVSTQPQLFVQLPKFLPNQFDRTEPGNPGIQLTYNQVNMAGPVYQSFLPGGFLFYFGMTSNIAVPIILSPAPTRIVSAIAIPNTMTTVGTPVPFNVSTEINTTLNDRFTIHSTLNAGGPIIPYSFTWYAVALQ